MEHMRACNPRGPLVVYVCKVRLLSRLSSLQGSLNAVRSMPARLAGHLRLQGARLWAHFRHLLLPALLGGFDSMQLSVCARTSFLVRLPRLVC